MKPELKFKKGDIVYDVDTNKAGYVVDMLYDVDIYPDWKIIVRRDDFKIFIKTQNKLDKCYPDN